MIDDLEQSNAARERLDRTEMARRKYLLEHYFFRCDCARCVAEATLGQASADHEAFVKRFRCSRCDGTG